MSCPAAEGAAGFKSVSKVPWLVSCWFLGEVVRLAAASPFSRELLLPCWIPSHKVGFLANCEASSSQSGHEIMKEGLFEDWFDVRKREQFFLELKRKF